MPWRTALTPRFWWIASAPTGGWVIFKPWLFGRLDQTLRGFGIATLYQYQSFFISLPWSFCGQRGFLRCSKYIGRARQDPQPLQRHIVDSDHGTGAAQEDQQLGGSQESAGWWSPGRGGAIWKIQWPKMAQGLGIDVEGHHRIHKKQRKCWEKLGTMLDF